MIRRSALLTLLFILFYWDQGAARAAEPYVSSSCYCLLEGNSGQILAAKNSDVPRPIASTTKIMTAVLALEYCEQDELATVSLNADRTLEYTIGLGAGQKITVGELLKAALVRSANDAAVVLAEHVAGDEALFGHLMSVKAFCLGAFNTHYVNASGLPASEAYSTAYDLAVMSRYAMANPALSKIVSLRQTSFRHPGYARPLIIFNTNTLLDNYPGANGVKTGTTDAAGKCLVGSAVRQGREILAVVLRSADRAGDCSRLLDYGFREMKRVKAVDSQQSFKEIDMEKAEPSRLEIFPAGDLELWQGDKDKNIEKRVKMNYLFQAPVSKGEKVGFLEVYAHAKLVQRIPLIAGHTVQKEPPLPVKLWREILLWKRNIDSSKE